MYLESPMSQNKQNKIQIKYENAINYKPNPDSDYFVSDLLQNHLKLRVLRSGSKVWVYDYIYNGKRKRHTFGKLSKERKGDGYTPTQARDAVSNWEAIRNRGKNPLAEVTANVRTMTLNKFFDEEFLELSFVKPSETQNQQGKAVRLGNSEDEYYAKQKIWSRHIRRTLGDLPVVDITTKQVSVWFDKIAKATPSHSIKVLGLAKFVTKELLLRYEDLDNLTSNKFDRINTQDIRKAVDLSRSPTALTSQEFKAIWNACDEWYNRVEGLYVQFMMLVSARGKNVSEIRLDDIKQMNGKYMFNILHKGKPFPIVLNDLAEEVYLKTLEARKQYDFISPYLFPHYVYDSERKVIGVTAKPMSKDTRQRIWRGRSTKQSKGMIVKAVGGIKGIASMTVPSVATKSIHQIRHTYATNAENSYEAKDLLQNRTVGVIDKHYRQKDFENSLKLAEKQSEIANQLLN